MCVMNTMDDKLQSDCTIIMIGVSDFCVEKIVALLSVVQNVQIDKK